MQWLLQLQGHCSPARLNEVNKGHHEGDEIKRSPTEKESRLSDRVYRMGIKICYANGCISIRATRKCYRISDSVSK